MSRGHGRVQRTILARVASSTYGCTIADLVWSIYGGAETTEAQVLSVRRAVGRLIAEGRLTEQPGYYDRRLRPAPPSRPPVEKPGTDADANVLRCASCDVQWRADGAASPCWSCGQPGTRNSRASEAGY